MENEIMEKFGHLFVFEDNIWVLNYEHKTDNISFTLNIKGETREECAKKIYIALNEFIDVLVF